MHTEPCSWLINLCTNLSVGRADHSTCLGTQVVAFNLDSYAKYNMESSLSVAGIKAFAQGLVAGTVKPHYKSEEVCLPIRSWN